MEDKQVRKRNNSKSERNSAKSIQIPDSVNSVVDSSAGLKKGRSIQDYFGDTKQQNRSRTNEKSEHKKTAARKPNRQAIVGENLSGRFEAVSEAVVVMKEEDTSIQKDSWRSDSLRMRNTLGISQSSLPSSGVGVSREESSFPGPTNTKIEDEETFIEDAPAPRVKIEGDTIEFGDSTEEAPLLEAVSSKTKIAKDRKGGDRASLGSAAKYSVMPGTGKALHEVFTDKVMRSLAKIEMELESTAFHKASFHLLRDVGCEYLNWLLERSILVMKSQKKKRLTLSHMLSALAEDPRTSFLIDAMTFEQPVRESRKSKPSEAEEKQLPTENLLNLPRLSNDRSMSEPLSQIDSNVEIASSTKMTVSQPNTRPAKSRIEALPEASSSSHSHLQIVKEEPNPGEAVRRNSKSREVIRGERTKKEAD